MDGFSYVIAHGAVQGFPRAVVSVSAHVAEELVAWEESVVCVGVCGINDCVDGCGIIDCIDGCGIIDCVDGCGIIDCVVGCGIIDCIDGCGIIDCVDGCGIIDCIVGCGIIDCIDRCGITDCIGITGFSITCFVHCSRCITHTIHRITTTHTITHTLIHIIPSQQRLRQRHVHERVAAPQVARQTLAQLCRTLVAVP